MRKFSNATFRHLLTLSFGFALAVATMTTTPASAQTGAVLHANTLANNPKSNQNKSWFHDGKWWMIAPDVTKNADYIWRYDGGGVWTRTSTKLEKGSLNRYDVFMDSAIGELSVLRSHTTYVKFFRYNYSGGSWSLAVSSVASNFGNPDNSNPVSLTKAKNGEFWIFRIDTTLQARRSTDGGATWRARTIIKTGLNTIRGTTDAVTYTKSGVDFVGVGYGEVGTNGVNTKYGFVFHRDIDGPLAWTDESVYLTYAGSEKGHNQLSLTVDDKNNIYFFTRNFGGAAGNPRNTLYKRTGSKTWQRHSVNLVSDAHAWFSPAVAIDSTNDVVIVGGIRTDSSFAEYKCVAIGSEATLLAAARGTLLRNGSDIFADLNFPRNMVNNVNGLMTTAANTTQNKIWFNVFLKNPVVPILVDTVHVVLNEVNANGRYTIPLTLTDLANGGLNAGVGKIALRFTATTIMPASISPALVSLNGINAFAVTTTPATKEMLITTATNIAGNAAVTVVIDSLAGVINKQKPGLDSLQAWTTAQPIPVYSPAFTLFQATSKVGAATVTPEPTIPGSHAAYTIGFRVGKRGRMLGNQDTVRLKFNAQTQVANGALTGVLVNSAAATATGDTINRTIHVKLPASVTVLNQDTLTLYFPSNHLTNPTLAGLYSIFVSTSVETCQVASNLYEIGAVDTCGTQIPGTTGLFARGNQSKTFFHGDAWWLIAAAEADLDWYLWKFDGIGWTQGIKIAESSKDRPDVWLESSKNKAYVLIPGATITTFVLLNYSGGLWSIDSDYPTTVNTVQNNEMNLARAKDGDFWAFWTADSSIWVQRSDDEGETWFPAKRIKKLNVFNALTDAVQVKIGGNFSIGLGYAENSSSPASQYGFLHHKDGDPDSVWTDETASKFVPIHPAGTSSDNHLNMISYNGEIFMIVKTKGGSGNFTTKNALYHRVAAGTWSRYDILQGNGWTRPVAGIDVTNGVFYAFGIREGGTKVIEMKRVALGDYSSLLTAPLDTVLCNHPDNFFDITVPMHTFNSASNLMLVAENDTKNQIWFKYLLLAPLVKTGAAFEDEQAIAATNAKVELTAGVYPNPFNPRTAIKFTLPQQAEVKLQIFNLNGQLVRTLVNTQLPAGAHERRWNARDEFGRRVASGLYIYRLQVGPNVLTGNMQLLK